MMLNIAFGGEGVGLMNMIIYVLLTVFICALMIGRTPEFLGKKIESAQMKLIALVILIHPLLILVLSALAVVFAKDSISNPSFHGLAQILYEFSSSAANNGSGLEGLKDDNLFWNLSTAFAMFCGRYLVLIAQLAIAGSLLAKNTQENTANSLKTDNLTFMFVLVCIIYIFAALTFFSSAYFIKRCRIFIFMALRRVNVLITFILFVTLLFANFAESIAEGRGKAQAATLRQSKKDSKARRIKSDGSEEMLNSSELKIGDIVLVKAGELIPNDGEIIEGAASVDESAITGESAPVMREAGGDFSSVTGGTTVLTDFLKIKILVGAGESFLDKMINLVEGAARQKTPNEIALNTLLIALSLSFLVVVVSLYPFIQFLGVSLPISWLVALLVCLIPTTIGGLLSAIGIAGMDRVTRFNVIALSGKAVESCGDVDTMILDKTGTITFGNRLANEFYEVQGISKEKMIKACVLSSLKDETPEGKSIVALA